ncbi:hypothetical protein L4D20_04355 [Vibrio kyushuensis]|uniref:hypothetical protein n=1 Tax=Vibrio kyushuensis TaxID=2910249 RepID=UPI003D13C2DC
MLFLPTLKKIIFVGMYLISAVALFACSSNSSDMVEMKLVNKSLPTNQLSIVTYNNKFVGHYKLKDNEAIANILSNYDLVFIQELVAPPYDGSYPNGKKYRSDPESKGFFEGMISAGFNYVLSEEDTGASSTNHSSTTSTEWFVAFYKPGIVQPKPSLIQGFVDLDRSNNDVFDRVPYAFSFKHIKTKTDFVVISTHLAAGASPTDGLKRSRELDRIYSWVESNKDKDDNFIILGDMNFKNCAEISSSVSDDYNALNKGINCKKTNVSNNPKPYDNVLILKTNNTDIKYIPGIEVVELRDKMLEFWPEDSQAHYPGDPYDGNKFSQYYSDHNPVLFYISTYSDTD